MGNLIIENIKKGHCLRLDNSENIKNILFELTKYLDEGDLINGATVRFWDYFSKDGQKLENGVYEINLGRVLYLKNKCIST